MPCACRLWLAGAAPGWYSDFMEPVSPALLRRYSLFGGLVDGQLQRLIDRIETLELPVGAELVRQGEHGDRMYCLVAGEVVVERGSKVVARLGPGETIGEMELLDMLPRSATVRAVFPSQFLGLALRDILLLQCEDLPAFTLVVMNLARDLSRRLRKMDAAATGLDPAHHPHRAG